MPPRLRTLSNNVISTYNAEDIIVGHAIPSAELKALSLAIRSEVAREREMSDGRSNLKLLPPIGPSVRPSVRPTDGARSSIAVRRVTTVTITVITIIAERSRKYQLFDEQHSRCNANAARGHERWIVGARAAFKFPLCCCESVDRPDRKSGYDFTFSIPEFRTIGISEAHTCPRMAQNVNPFSSTQNTPPKATEGKQPMPKDNHAVSKRLQKELMVLMMSTEQGVSAFPEGENLFKWIGTITGPKDTVYAGLTYKLTLEFPHSYPYSAPIVRFATPCFHPNVDTVGNICLDILKDKWSALYDVRTILLSIQSLLSEPNNDSPLNIEAAELWRNQTKYKKYLTEEYHRARDRAQSNRNQQDS
ncbi:hypothetical protein HN011_012317 [Eciton burchellii]|nr:hypothetical protein HN011_012317 [Eciton burchellii]